MTRFSKENMVVLTGWKNNMINSISKEKAFQKLRHYCDYQERSHYETKTKAYSLGLRKIDVEELTARLIEENYLNEERFAIKYARGKFTMNDWGKMKIRNMLKARFVSEYCIRKALSSIDQQAYNTKLEKLAAKRWNSIRGRGVNVFVRITKTRDYLLQKGFEINLVRNCIQQLSSDRENMGSND